MPHVEWTEKNMRYMLCAFPLVGAVVGLLLWGWVWICGVLGFGRVLCAAGISLLPVLATGGIHLDGFCDTTDALASHASPARRREILKDPHTGAFAVIGVCAYLLAYCALSAELAAGRQTAWLLGLMHILSRSFSALAVIGLPGAGAEGMAGAFRAGADKKRAAAVLLSLSLFTAAAMIFLSWPAGLAMVFSAVLCLFCLRHLADKTFGGMSGDLAGWFLQIAEISMLTGLVLMERMAIR